MQPDNLYFIKKSTVTISENTTLFLYAYSKKELHLVQHKVELDSVPKLNKTRDHFIILKSTIISIYAYMNLFLISAILLSISFLNLTSGRLVCELFWHIPNF